MGNVFSGRDGPVIGINSSLEMYKKLKYESSRLENGWHIYDAFNFIVTARHLSEDWIKKDTLLRLPRTKINKSSDMDIVLDIIRDLANGSKHFQLEKKAAAKRIVSETHIEKEASWYSYFFHENIPGVTVDNYDYFSIRVLKILIIRYFDWVFDDSCPANNFPSDLSEAILYCNLANRGNKPMPILLAQGI